MKINSQHLSSSHKILDRAMGRIETGINDSIIKSRTHHPISIFIVNDSGTTIYSKRFQKNKFPNEILLGGFLTSINLFMVELFDSSESIDTIKLKGFTIKMAEINSFKLWYIFAGNKDDALIGFNSLVYSLKSKYKHYFRNIKKGIGLGKTEKTRIDKIVNETIFSIF